MSMPLGEDARANARRLRDKKNIKWQYLMPCSLLVLEPLLNVEPRARQLRSANSARWDTREQLMAFDVAAPIRDVVELFQVCHLLLRLVELLVADEPGVVGVRRVRECEEKKGNEGERCGVREFEGAAFCCNFFAIRSLRGRGADCGARGRVGHIRVL
jgi:hypothetical protein